MSSDLTDDDVRAVLSRVRNNRKVEYLCRAFLQFGAAAMSPDDYQRLRVEVAKRSKP